MNKYELTLVLDGKSGAAKRKAQIEKIAKVISAFKGKIAEEKDWGVKDLAYKIGKSETGLYTLFELEMESAGAKSLNEKLRTDADVLRFLLINKDK